MALGRKQPRESGSHVFTRIIVFGRRNALGLIAIFIAMSGTAYAATSLPHNSVRAPSSCEIGP